MQSKVFKFLQLFNLQMSAITEQEIEDYAYGYKDYVSPLINMLSSKHDKIIDSYLQAFAKAHSTETSDDTTKEQVKEILTTVLKPRMQNGLLKLHEAYSCAIKIPTRAKKFIKAKLEHEKLASSYKFTAKEEYNQNLIKLMKINALICTTKKGNEAANVMKGKLECLVFGSGLSERIGECKRMIAGRTKAIITEPKQQSVKKIASGKKFVIRRLMSESQALQAFAPMIEYRNTMMEKEVMRNKAN